MITTNGITYMTIVDAAEELRVSAKTVRSYIAQGIIPEPPLVQYGNRTVQHFSRKYLDTAKKKLAAHRAAKTVRD
jgi:DNA-binding transcriptional MerR regulator